MWAFLFKMAKTYYEKLKDPRWQKKRLEVFNRDNFACTKCKSKDNTLNVHHKKYAKNGDPWGVELEDLVSLCENCHKKYEDNKKEIIEALVESDYFYAFLGYEFRLEDIIRSIHERPQYGEIIQKMLSQINDDVVDAYEIGCYRTKSKYDGKD